MGLKNSITQLENSRGNLLSRLDQTEDKILGLEDKIEGLDHTSKENEKNKSTRKGKCRTCEIPCEEQIFEL